ncbi:hypothetical protein LTR36_001905 [Oleoguttula mirabilis]|uniref:Uncharacterized protein n=1 Tax=Oleoguttula mirabilis TaxID=1507867 RepID=A0AAV9JMV6_9PEZI|nr:hypothetical protein LTR36_001905 [Oleoguttula mirabilis]
MVSSSDAAPADIAGGNGDGVNEGEFNASAWAAAGDNNTLRVYYALDTNMIQLHKKGSVNEAEHIARTLVSYADLPLLLRARACLVMAHSTEPGYVQWAREAVRIAQMCLDHATEAGVDMPTAEQRMLAQCEEALQNAQDDLQKEEAEEEEEEEEELPSMSMSAADRLVVEGAIPRQMPATRKKHGLATLGGVSRTTTGPSRRSTCELLQPQQEREGGTVTKEAVVRLGGDDDVDMDEYEKHY